MAKRRSVSKKTRFEIFKRDSFTCQYCGRTSEDTILELDHIIPVSKDGTNDEMNLVTSCFDCNRGKGNRELGSIIPRPDADLKYLETQQEIQELKRYKLAKTERDKIATDVALDLANTYRMAFNSSWAPEDRHWLALLSRTPPEIIEKAIYIASQKQDLSGSWNDRFAYICGICKNMTKAEE